MKISIITVCYNSEKSLARTIESILSQENVQIEYLIIDGDSKDQTVIIAESYRKEFEKKGYSFVLNSEPDGGIYDAMNKGIKLATGDIIGILNSDDYYASSDVLSSVINGFECYGLDSLFGNLLYVKGGKPYRYWKSGKPRSFRYGWMPPHPAFFVKKYVYQRYGLFRLDCGTAADYELMLRFLEKYKVSTKWINKIFTNMEAGGASGASLTAYKKSHQNDIKAWVINDLKPALGFAWMKKIRKVPQFITAKFVKMH